MADDFNITVAWCKEEYGHVYTAKAVTKSGRILAVVNIEVPLDVEINIRERFGEEWVQQVEASAKREVELVANGWKLPAHHLTEVVR